MTPLTLPLSSVVRALVALVFVALSGACAGEDAKPPNLLIIVSDALRADALGCYGGTARTPNIDSLAEGGVLFERGYSTAPWTWPSSVSMFTGRLPGAYVARAIQFSPDRQPKTDPEMVPMVPDEEHLLSESLQAAGYELRMALQNQFPRRSNSLQGFVELEAPETPEVSPEALSIAGPAVRNSPKLFPLLDYLLGVPTDRPFYLLAWVLDPHSNYNAPRRFRRRINTDGKKLPREEAFYTNLDHRQLRQLTLELTDSEKDHIKALYLAEVEFVDQRVGFILRMLEHRGLDSNTIVILTSDHGEAFWEHGHPSHGTTYFKEMVHIPLIIAGPGLTAGKRVTSSVSLLGLPPTVAELLGVELPDDVQGRSYAGFLRGATPDLGPIYFMSAYGQLHDDAILDGNFKLITGPDGSRALYNLEADPGETVEISTDYPDVVARLEAQRRKIKKENHELRQQWKMAARTETLPADDLETLEQLKALGYVE